MLLPIQKKTFVCNRRFLRQQSGVALIFVLLMLMVTIGVVVISVRMTLGGTKASTNDRDRQIALQAAELALNDAELDIMDINLTEKGVNQSQGVTTGRACKLGNPAAAVVWASGCGKKRDGTDRIGLCAIDPARPDISPYALVDWTVAENSDDRGYAIFGEFTGRGGQLALGAGIAPAQPPRYIIVQSPVKLQILQEDGAKTFEVAAAYKVYALGYGANKETQVMLESEIYKPILEKNCGATAS